MVSIHSHALKPEDVAALDKLTTRAPGASRWRAVRCCFDSGIEDVVAVLTEQSASAVRDFFQQVWPTLRRGCAQDLNADDLSDDAILWMVSQKVNACVLVLDEDRRVLRANAAGREILEEGSVLCQKGEVLHCVGEREDKALRAAIAETLTGQVKTGSEYILILRGAESDVHVPMSLSPYRHDEQGARLFLAMLPMPPDQKRIEALAVKMGLTPSEARVAALIRAGHSNRQAAEIAGLKVETFNTYAKRALSKMNASCRSEMAQMLTWQASMERSL